jgi:predicted RND superfamily exporter protein
MALAMKRAFSAIAASAATTVFGFLALVFMKFRIGTDLGLVLFKGVVLSFCR